MRCLVLIGAAALALTGPVSGAWADGDPASDVLLAQDVFLPYPPNGVSDGMRRALNTTVARASAAGFPVKVAIVASARDLGSLGALFADPQAYANALTHELSLNVQHGTAVAGPRVLTVLPSGLGGNNLGDDAGTALEGIDPVAAGDPDGLARAAAVAVARLAAADGKPIPAPVLPKADAAPADGDGGGVPAGVTFGAPMLLVVLVALGLNARNRRSGRPEPPPP